MIHPILGRLIPVKGTAGYIVISSFETLGYEGGVSNQVSETIS